MEESKKELLVRDVLKAYVLDQWTYSADNIMDRHDAMRRYYDQYRGTRTTRKQFWQADYVIPSLKEAIRIKIPLFLNILFSQGYESFDIEPGCKEDEHKMFYIKNLLIYGLRKMGKRRGGLYGQMEDFMKQRELYGYTVGRVFWKDEHDVRGRLKYHSPEFETLDIFSVFPDPGSISINDSWVILQTRNVFISRLRDLENQGIYENIVELKDSSQPESLYPTAMSDIPQGKVDNRVELLEYHGEVPKSLMEGDYFDIAQVNPYEDEYVDAIITLANRNIIIRRDVNPYKTSVKFIEASKDRLPNEMIGTGTAEDIEAMAQELTNAHNKLTDCVNIVSNPMSIVNPGKVSGATGTIMTYPGKVFTTNPGVDNVSHAMVVFDTSPQAAALSPLMSLIGILKEEIQKNTQAVPVISPVVSREGLPETLGATQMVQANASEPIKHDVKHSFEPAFEQMLEIMLELYEQFLEEAPAYQILGKEKAEQWARDRKSNKINRKDIALKERPTFIAKGVSVFAEKQVETEKLIRFLEVTLKATAPAIDEMGNPMLDANGEPIPIPKADVAEIIKRIAELSGFKNLEDLLPSLRQKRLAEQGLAAGTPQGSLPSAQSPEGSPVSPAGLPQATQAGRGGQPGIADMVKQGI